MKPDKAGLRLAIIGPLVVIVGFVVILFGLSQKQVEILQATAEKLEAEISVNETTMASLNDRMIALRESMILIGICSWYGDVERGRKTANQEIFNPNELTAASLFLQFQSRWKVTRIDTGASVTVRINDVIPGRHGRILDLSQAAAARLGMIERGIVKVRISPEY